MNDKQLYAIISEMKKQARLHQYQKSLFFAGGYWQAIDDLEILVSEIEPEAPATAPGVTDSEEE